MNRAERPSAVASLEHVEVLGDGSLLVHVATDAARGFSLIKEEKRANLRGARERNEKVRIFAHTGSDNSCSR